MEKLDIEEKADAIKAVEDHFVCLMEFQEEFFGKVWEYMRKYIQIGQHEPHFLVKLLRVVESDRRNNEFIKKRFTHLVVRAVKLVQQLEAQILELRNQGSG